MISPWQIAKSACGCCYCCCYYWVTTDSWGRPSEALELRVENGRVNYSWWVGVVSHSHGGYGWGRDGGGDWQACGTKPEGVDRMSGDVGALRDCEVKTLITPLSTCAALFKVGPELVGLPGKALTMDATRLYCDINWWACLHLCVICYAKHLATASRAF